MQVECCKAGIINIIGIGYWFFMDEMYVKKSLVYDKHTGKMIGFTDLGDVNNCLISLEQALSSEVEQDPTLAHSMMVFMVRGIFTSFQYIYAQFPCSTLIGDLIFDPFWESIFDSQYLIHFGNQSFILNKCVLKGTFKGALINFFLKSSY